ncbi:MAG: endonuclease domain-containing protein [Thermodesulfobacteriota bacterium]|nr:endonuclease domain-containing protein [Thermodesulfobacteriota bacterium]
MSFIRNHPELKERRCELRRNQTEAEKLLWGYLRKKQFKNLKFFRQYSVGVYILDFYCPKLKLGVELDGGQHADEKIREYEMACSEYLRTQGIEVIRFWNQEVMKNIEGVLCKIGEKITPPNLPLA